MNNYRYVEFLEACHLDGIKPSTWAVTNGLGNSMPTNLKNGIRPNIDTLRKLTNGWRNSESGLKILVAHLKDEVESAGHSLDAIHIARKKNVANSDVTLDDDLRTIQEFMSHRPIRESIHNLSALLKISEWAKDKSNLSHKDMEASVNIARMGAPRPKKLHQRSSKAQ